MANKQLKKKIQHHSDTFYITRQNPGIVQSWNDSRTQVNRNRRETREAISKASIMVPSSAPEIAIPYNGTPVKDKATHVSYIGGNKDAARKAYWEEAPIIKAATDSIAGRYGINPELLRNRLNKEGFTDHAIANYNAINIYVPQEFRDAMRHKVLSYNFINRDATIDDATSSFGLDDAATYINSGLASLINERWQDTEFKNEKGRETHPASGITGKDNMGIMAAVIKGFRDQAAKDYPNATPEELDNYANIYYNRGITGGRNYINSGNGSTPYTMAEGGPLHTHKTWDDLSMTEKADMMKVAVRNGITSLNEIKAHYNEFAEGRNLYGGGSYLDKAKAMIRANEGWRSTPYKDAPKGKNWRSVGYGFNDSGFWEKYPEGISKHYEKGMTKAQAEQELAYYLGKAERQLRGIYGKKWDSFNDDQKAAILDTYYQSPASVGSKSGFYSAVMAGRDGAPYLGVRGFWDRNQSRRDLYRGRGVSASMTFDTVSEPVSTEPEMISFKPLNPQAFDNPMFTYTPPTLMEEPVQVNPLAEAYSPEELERQEKRDNLERFNMFMNMLSSPSGEDNTGLTGMLGAMSMLNGNKKAYGGNIYDGNTEFTQQMQQGYIRQRPEGTYFYDVEGQPEIDVTPLNTSLSSNPADWSFTDASGKIYSPHRDAIQGTGELREGSQEGPILSAVNNYLKELNWRAKNDPSSIALQGKYTMPAIATTALLPWIGEAAAATNVAGVPLMTWADAGLTTGFGAHGLNHLMKDDINGWGDATMTALEVAPLGRLAKPIYEGVVQPGMRLFNSPLTGNWTKIGNREYRLSPNSLGANGAPVESRPIAPQITAENAASITPEQWTAAQDAAIAKGDMAEAQRLRDLHQSLTPTATPGKYYRGTKTKRNSYLDRHIDEEVGEMNGIYLTKKPKYAKTYGNVEEFYLRSNNPLETEGSWTGVIDDATRLQIENAGYDAVVNNRFDTGFLNKLLRNSRDETITFDGRNLKLADAVTYDNNGTRIPLGKRDNFNINDIRYELLPFGIGLTGYGILGRDR